MAIRRPPQHAADAAPIYIAGTDDAWDAERIKAERAALKNERSNQRHVVDVYFSGLTRYDLDAGQTVGGRVVTPRHYLRDGASPTVFHLRRVSGLRREQAVTATRDPAAWVAALWDLARQGVVKATEGFDGPAWDLEGGSGGLPLTDADLQLLYEADRGLPEALGFAVLQASAPLSEAEGKR